MFKPGDYVKLMIPFKTNWHLAKRWRGLNTTITHIVSITYKNKGNGLSFRTKGYYKTYLTGRELIPPECIRPLFDHDGPITEDVVLANRVVAKLNDRLL